MQATESTTTTTASDSTITRAACPLLIIEKEDSYVLVTQDGEVEVTDEVAHFNRLFEVQASDGPFKGRKIHISPHMVVRYDDDEPGVITLHLRFGMAPLEVFELAYEARKLRLELSMRKGMLEEVLKQVKVKGQ